MNSFLLFSFSEKLKELVGDWESTLLFFSNEKKEELFSSSIIDESFLPEKNKFSSAIILSLNWSVYILLQL